MKEPHPPKAKAAAPRKDPPAARSASRVERQLRVRFYCSMKPRRVYPLLVAVEPARGGAPTGPSTPVVIRPVIPGALVAPVEATLDGGQANAQARFQVMPLARGRLPDARVEVHQQGRLADQMRLRMKAFTQRRTWLLLLLTILIPWFILAVTSERYYKMRGKIPGKPPELAADPGEMLQYTITSWSSEFLPRIPALHDYIVNPVAKALGFVYNWACNLAPDHLYFWVGVILLGLTAVSWIGRRAQRTSRRKPLPLAAPVPIVEAAETLPLTAREQAPVSVQPAE